MAMASKMPSRAWLKSPIGTSWPSNSTVEAVRAGSPAISRPAKSSPVIMIWSRSRRSRRRRTSRSWSSIESLAARYRSGFARMIGGTNRRSSPRGRAGTWGRASGRSVGRPGMSGDVVVHRGEAVLVEAQFTESRHRQDHGNPAGLANDVDLLDHAVDQVDGRLRLLEVIVARPGTEACEGRGLVRFDELAAAGQPRSNRWRCPPPRRCPCRRRRSDDAGSSSNPSRCSRRSRPHLRVDPGVVDLRVVVRHDDAGGRVAEPGKRRPVVDPDPQVRPWILGQVDSSDAGVDALMIRLPARVRRTRALLDHDGGGRRSGRWSPPPCRRSRRSKSTAGDCRPAGRPDSLEEREAEVGERKSPQITFVGTATHGAMSPQKTAPRNPIAGSTMKTLCPIESSFTPKSFTPAKPRRASAW